MSRFSQLSAHGMSIHLPAGWDGEIYVRDLDGDPTDDIVDIKPVMHAANFPLPRGRGDFGSVAVEAMARPGVFLAVLEYEESSARERLFRNPFPSRLFAREFGPTNLQRPLPGQAGAQRFCSSGKRAFCVYAVLGNYGMRRALVPELNRALGTVAITPASD
ncbi:MAG: hypothetical protein ACR2PK_16880 [Acidimicrobiales bacterium]